MQTKYSFEDVKSHFERESCKLLATEYKNADTSMPYICSCGNKSKISYYNFKKGVRCLECLKGRLRLPFEEVKAHFEREGCKLLATEYKTTRTPMLYICECGNESNITYARFKEGVRCRKCFAERMKLPFEKVKNTFEKEGCTLLATEYKNSNTLMPYICSCGNKSKIRYKNFKLGVRCEKCKHSTIKYSFEYVKAHFDREGCTLLATEYKNNRTLMPYICSCGNKSKIRYCDFKIGRKCRKCKKK